MLAPVLIFLVTYLVLSGVRLPLVRLDRTAGALVGAVAMVLVSGMDRAAAYQAVNWDTIALLLGMMIITAFLVEAGLFRWVAWQTVRHARDPRRLLFLLVLVAGTLSAVLVNDTVCVMFTPLVVAVIEEAALPPLPFLLGLASAANLGGVVTYTGNPQNMIVGTHAPISFAGYLLRMLPVGVLGLAVNAALLLWMFRRELGKEPIAPPKGTAPTLDRRLAGISLAMLGLVLVGFLARLPLAGTALAGGALLLLVSGRGHRPPLARVDFALLLFFASLFVVVAGLERSGALDQAFEWVVPHLGHTAAGQLGRFTILTVIGSNVFSNVPFVLLAVDLVPRLHDPTRGWLVLAMASTLAGNLTIFGSVANLIVLELAGRHGRVGFWRFLRYGAVITGVTTSLGLAVLLIEAWFGW
jgi:Na+/H+ antiporter NhaD/arsenite permease-like protein